MAIISLISFHFRYYIDLSFNILVVNESAFSMYDLEVYLFHCTNSLCYPSAMDHMKSPLIDSHIDSRIKFNIRNVS